LQKLIEKQQLSREISEALILLGNSLVLSRSAGVADKLEEAILKSIRQHLNAHQKGNMPANDNQAR